MPLAQGQTLHDRYRIVKLIGQGGFGAVYRAWDLSLKQPCALKENLDASPEAQRQFEREATILAGLRHPNLPRVTDYFFLPGQGQYLVMDFIEGHNLVSAVQQNGGPLPESQALEWIEQVCAALTYLHGQNPAIIHRDIKPQNIIITPAGQAILVDFGISKIYDAALSTTGGARGVTPGFSPPEQYGRARTDPRSDLYALAATLYYLLTVQEPPDAMERIVHSAPLTPPRQCNPTITPAAEQAILCALEIESGRRFASVKDFRQALVAPPTIPPTVQMHQPMPAGAPTFTPAAAPQIRPLTPAHAAASPGRAIPASSARKRPRGVTLVAVFCILAGLIISSNWLFPATFNFNSAFQIMVNTITRSLGSIGCIVISVFGLLGCILMLLADNRGRQISLIFLGLLNLLTIIAQFRLFTYGYSLSLSIALTTLIGIYSFFYLFHIPVLDYFLPGAAPHISNPARVLNALGRWHFILGFWLVLPIIIGIGLLNHRSRYIWWSAYLTSSLLCLTSLIILLMSIYGIWFVGGFIEIILLLIFALESQVWLYLRRPEVRQLYP